MCHVMIQRLINKHTHSQTWGGVGGGGEGAEGWRQKVWYRINPPIRRFVYKTGAVFRPFPGRILLLLNYKTG